MFELCIRLSSLWFETSVHIFVVNLRTVPTMYIRSAHLGMVRDALVSFCTVFDQGGKEDLSSGY